MSPCLGLVKIDVSTTSTSVKHDVDFLHTTFLFRATLNKQWPSKIDYSVGEDRIFFHTKLRQGRGRRNGIMLFLYLLEIYALQRNLANDLSSFHNPESRT